MKIGFGFAKKCFKCENCPEPFFEDDIEKEPCPNDSDKCVVCFL